MEKKELVKLNSKKIKAKDGNRDLKNDFSELAKVLTGEMSLRKKEEEAKRLKELAIKRHKQKMRSGVEEGDIVLDKATEKTVIQKIDLFEWEAPIRTSFNFDMKVFVGIVILSLIFILFLAILGNYPLMFAIIALLFFIYVAGTTEPIKVTHKITTQGIETTDKLYEWFMLDKFWFANKNGQNLLIVSTKLRAPANLIMLLDEKDRAAIFVLLQDTLLYRDVKKLGRVEQLTFGEYIPMEEV